MNQHETAAVIERIVASWPNGTWTEGTSAVWVEACATINYDDAVAAVQRLVRTDDFLPSFARFAEACRLVDTEHRNRRALPAGNRAEDCKRNEGMFEFLRDAWHDASEGRPEHNHKNGDDNCPVCSTSREFVARSQVEITKAMRNGWDAA